MLQGSPSQLHVLSAACHFVAAAGRQVVSDHVVLAEPCFAVLLNADHQDASDYKVVKKSKDQITWGENGQVRLAGCMCFAV